MCIQSISDLTKTKSKGTPGHSDRLTTGWSDGRWRLCYGKSPNLHASAGLIKKIIYMYIYPFSYLLFIKTHYRSSPADAYTLTLYPIMVIQTSH